MKSSVFDTVLNVTITLSKTNSSIRFSLERPETNQANWKNWAGVLKSVAATKEGIERGKKRLYQTPKQLSERGEK